MDKSIYISSLLHSRFTPSGEIYSEALSDTPLTTALFLLERQHTEQLSVSPRLVSQISRQFALDENELARAWLMRQKQLSRSQPS